MQRDDTVAPRRRLTPRFVGIDSAVLAGFTALAAYTRYRPLAPRSLFLDDAWVSVGYRAHGLTQLARTTFTSPLFSLATDLWLKAVGLTSLRAQLLAFVAGVVAPAAMYLVARSMRLSRGVGARCRRARAVRAVPHSLLDAGEAVHPRRVAHDGRAVRRVGARSKRRRRVASSR